MITENKCYYDDVLTKNKKTDYDNSCATYCKSVKCNYPICFKDTCGKSEKCNKHCCEENHGHCANFRCDKTEKIEGINFCKYHCPLNIRTKCKMSFCNNKCCASSSKCPVHCKVVGHDHCTVGSCKEQHCKNSIHCPGHCMSKSHFHCSKYKCNDQKHEHIIKPMIDVPCDISYLNNIKKINSLCKKHNILVHDTSGVVFFT